MVLLIVPVIIVPILMLGRRLRKLSRENQDWIADSSGNASEALTSVQTIQAFTHEDASRARFGDVTEKKAIASARRRISTRAVMTHDRDLPGLHRRRGGAVDRGARRARRRDDPACWCSS